MLNFLSNQTVLKLELDNIELSYNNRKILSGIYLCGKTGEVTGILGRNGSGKTSLLRILFGNLNAKYGNVRLDGIHQQQKLFKTGKVAYLPQHQLLPKQIKVDDAFKTFNVNWTAFTTIFTSFERYRTWRVSTLSSGELRLIETYLILNSNKKIILLDEPFSFISPVYIDKIKAIIDEKKVNSVLVITDHFYEVILEISDHLYLIKNGCSKGILSKKQLQQEGYVS